MCGRYALAKTLDDMAEDFGAVISDSGLWDWSPNYNISPGAVVPVMAFNGRRARKIVPMRWGLHPSWKKTPPEGRPLFNARVKTAAEKPSFRTPMRRRRALIPATHFYEWERLDGNKIPYVITEEDTELFCFAGLWDHWLVDEGISLLSFTILTTAATGDVKHLHHRMPVRLPVYLWDDWLNWDKKPDRILQKMLSGDDLDYWQVGSEVNSGRASGEELLRAV